MRATRKRGILGAAALAAGLLLIAGAVPAFSSTQAPLRRIDPAAIGALPKDPVAYAHAKALANARYAKWAQRHGVTAPPASRYTAIGGGGALNQPGLAASDAPNLSEGGPFTPPDTTGAIGPSNYVEMVNSEIGVYDSSDLTASPTTLDQASFFGDATASTCDGQIQWDEEGQRWIYTGLNCNADSGQQALYVGFSRGTSPLPLSSSNWCRYRIPTGLNLEDYPKLGHDDTQIIIGSNEFSDDGFGPYTGSNVYVLPKPAPGTISTCPSQTAEVTNSLVTLTLSSPDAFTPVPVNLADSSADGYVVAADDVSGGGSSTSLYLYDITSGVTSGSMSPTTTVTVPSYSLPASVPQPGTSDTLDSLDARLTQAVAVTDPNTGEEGIWTQHTVDGGGPSVVRWYELTPGQTTPAQTGTVSGPGGAFAFEGAISPAGNGTNAAIFYNSGSSSQRADFRVRDRRSDTASGTMIEDLQLAASAYVDQDFSCPSISGGFYGPTCRWGDYNGASPDPSSPCIVWGTGELTSSAADDFNDAQWGSRNAAIDTSSGSCSVEAIVAKSGAGSGTVTSDVGGIDCGETCSASYDAGDPVTLTATPADGSVFEGWSGACSGAGMTCDLTMNQVKLATATFIIPKTLTFTQSGTGSGSVSSNPSGLDCSASCSHDFDLGTSVRLTAHPGTGSTFSGWSGDCTGTGACNVTMDVAHSVTATFTLIPETLTVSKSGAGSGTVTGSGISCGSTCSHSYTYGTSVTLTAASGTGSVFTGWSGGGCSGTGNCTVSMTAAQAVTATFGLVSEALTVSKSGTGSGTVASTISGISCGSTCSHNFTYGTSVTLTATPDAHVTFDGWSGACSGTGSCTVSLTAARSVTATFTAVLCEVPGLKGKTLAGAKSAIRNANCTVGSVTKKFSKKVKKGRVISQSPASGSEKAFGSAVKLVVSKGKPKP